MTYYKYGKVPSETAYKEETADFWEISALKEFNISISQLDILKVVAKEFDEIDNDGLDSQEDFYSDRLQDIYSHLKQRQKFSNGFYPFQFKSTSIKIDKIESSTDYLYVFLLLATRFNMNKDKVQGKVDGTELFEHICAHAIKNYVGNKAESFVFGTGEQGGFKSKVIDLIQKMGEGAGFANPNTNPPTKNDDGIDVVVWKEFSDNKPGKLIGFGQCKTGTTWRDKIHKLKPGDFCTNWFKESPLLLPVPIVFLTDTLNEDFNFISDQRGFLVFNRFRIIEYSVDHLPEDILSDIKKWVNAAIERIQNG